MIACPTARLVRPQNALLSVFDTTNLVPLALCLQQHGVELIATDGTCDHLRRHGLSGLTHTSDITGLRKATPGQHARRIRTLHPLIHEGIQMQRDDDDEVAYATAYGIRFIDIVVTNLRDEGPQHGHEKIDVGGLALIESAVRNCRWVVVMTSPERYGWLQCELNANQGYTSYDFRYSCAAHAGDMVLAYWNERHPRLQKAQKA
jgi:phosphoribosylaminoimidazolecarboxamide formyltransferase/IMP cyclohydrolase